jgi:hypothetical protein
MKKATRSEEQSSQSHGQHITSKAPTKIARVLGYQVFSGSLNRFEAERDVGDHCLHSTISSLAHGYGLNFERQLERVPNHWGQPCDVTRYSLPTSEHQKARTVLAMLCKRTKPSPAVTHE